MHSFYSGKKILVTGDSGFKGSWLSIWLLKLGVEVFGYSLPPQTENDNYVKTNLHTLIHHEDGDIRNNQQLTAYIKKINPDIVFHLAAQPIVLESYKNPVDTYSTNVNGTINILEALRGCPSVKAAVIVTTDKCYKNNEWEWGYRESDSLGGKDPYSASKACTEIIVHSYAQSFFQDSNCSIATGRAGNVIGGGDWAADRLIPDFFRAALTNESLEIRYPLSTRPWQHVLEPLFGYLILGQMLATKGKQYEGAWNFGPFPSKGFTVKDVIETLKATYKGKSPQINEANHVKFSEANFLSLDISKSMRNLGWRPVLNFKQTIDFTVKGYEDEISLNPSTQTLLNYRKLQIDQYLSLLKIQKNRDY